MKNLFLIMFFGKLILLTNSPISINANWTYVNFNKPVTAITSGAGILVDVSKLIPPENGLEALRGQFPTGTVEAVLYTSSGKELPLVHKGYYWSKNECMLALYHQGGMPKDLQFTHLKIRASVPLNNVKVLWKNYQQ